MKISTVVPALLAAILGSFVVSGCAVDADNDSPPVVTTPSKTDVTIEDKTPDVNVIKTEVPPSSNTTGGSTVTTG